MWRELCISKQLTHKHKLQVGRVWGGNTMTRFAYKFLGRVDLFSSRNEGILSNSQHPMF